MIKAPAPISVPDGPPAPPRLSLFTLAEIACLILVGRAFGVAATLGLLLLGSMLGALLLRHNGLRTLTQLRADIGARRAPAQTLADGALKAAAALLLIVPGFLSAAAGLLLLVPPVRLAVRAYAARRIEAVRARGGWRRAGPSTIDLDADEFRSGSRPSPALPPDGD